MSNNDYLSPREAWKLVNIELQRYQLKPIAAPMISNYTVSKLNAGERPLIKCERLADGRTHVDRNDLQRWLTTYITKKLGQKVAPKHEPLNIEL